MFKNYFKIAIRNFWRNKSLSIINISGLAIGMAVTMVIGLWIWQELSFNKNFPNYKSISQVLITGTFSGEISTDPVCPISLASDLKNNFGSSFKHVVLTSKPVSHILENGNVKLNSTGTFAQQGFVDILSLAPIKGSLQGLDNPSSILISASLAKSLFGNDEPVGKMLKIDNKDNITVDGVYNDFPATSSFNDLQYIASWNYFIPPGNAINAAWQFLLYVQLQNGFKNDDASKRISGVLKDYTPPEIKPVVLLHPMEKWHLYETFQNGKNTGGEIQYVWMFGIIGFFVLLLACINFMNLSTARSSKRAKEVGVLKTIGSPRKQIIIRFLGESMITAIVAFVITLILVQVCLRWFNQLSGYDMHIPFDKFWFCCECIAFVLFTGLVAGFYPAFYLSSFRPATVLKGGFKAGKSATVFRKILVGVQFFTSIFLITATIIVLKQLNYAKKRPLGYSVDGLISFPIKTPELQAHYNAFRNDLLRSGAAVNVAASSSPVNQLKFSTGGYSWQGKVPSTGAIFGTVSGTEDFGNTVKWHFIKGRNFSHDFPSDSSGVILNEMALHYMGISDAIGKYINYQGQSFKILGVIDNAIMGSPFASVTPTAFFLGQLPMDFITIKLSPSLSVTNTLKKVEAVFKQYSSDAPFDYSFVDKQYSKQFHSIETVATLAGVFAVLAIFISGLGLFGLSSFMAEQRVKEIGIRKVLGASVRSLCTLLTSEFLILNGVAFLIAIPVVSWSMTEWLRGYIYRTSISWMEFAFTGAITIVITLITVSFQAIKAAIANPVKSLRSE